MLSKPKSIWIVQYAKGAFPASLFIIFKSLIIMI